MKLDLIEDIAIPIYNYIQSHKKEYSKDFHWVYTMFKYKQYSIVYYRGYDGICLEVDSKSAISIDIKSRSGSGEHMTIYKILLDKFNKRKDIDEILLGLHRELIKLLYETY